MMATTARRPVRPLRFIAHRIIRVVPIYWLLKIISIIIIASGFNIFGHQSLSINRVMRSLFFLPDLLPNGTPLYPIFFVGWTLNYEMMFYSIFSIFLLIRSVEIRLASSCCAIISLWLAQLSGINFYLTYWGNDIVLAFVFGMLLWKVTLTLPLRFSEACLSIALGFVALTLPDLLSIMSGSRHSALLPDIGSALIVYGALSLERRSFSVGGGWLKRQGDASYSLYLIHLFIIQIVGKIWLRLHFNASIGGLVVMVPVMLAASGVCGTGLHRFVERPLTDWLRRLADQKYDTVPIVN